MASNIKKQISDMLTQLSKSELENFDEFRTKGNTLAQEIFQVLTTYTKSPYKFGRFRIAGSVGKRTSLGVAHPPDFDLVVFVNDERPPFKKVLEFFEKALREKYSNDNNNSDFELLGKTSHAIQFRMRPGSKNDNQKEDFISFDLLPAANLVQSNSGSQSDGASLERAQTIQALEAMAKFHDPRGGDARAYSTSLCEAGITFVKNQGVFVHDVIRLAKLWNLKVTWEGEGKGVELYGRSMIMELVAISVATKVENDAKVPQAEKMAEAFRLFLEKFKKIDSNMVVYFKFNGEKSQAKAYQAYLDQATSPKAPLILDPFNPFNNLASNFTTDMKAAFQAHANKTADAIVSNGDVRACFGF